MSSPVPKRGPDDLAIVLTGGGARAAYQVGFLHWIARAFPEIHFPIVTGVSAGAINAACLAASRGTHAETIAGLHERWRRLTVDEVFRTDRGSLAGHVARWAGRLLGGGARFSRPVRGLLDASPLRGTLDGLLELEPDGTIGGLRENIADGRLWALALITSHYASGQSVIWTQGRDLPEWRRPERRSRNTRLNVEHVLASAALPFFFPAIRLDDGWHGDGGIRLTDPFSPALRFGANRILAISTRFTGSSPSEETPDGSPYPPPLQIGGQLMNAIFLDDLDRDARELQRVNRLLRELPPEKRRGLREVDLLVVRPSADVGRLSAKFEPVLPKTFRYLLRGLGSREVRSPDLLSLLAFHPEYLEQLLELGERDAAAHANELRALLGAGAGAPAPADAVCATTA
ncbi:MAG: patatin [Acidobacteria bacterium]|nr:patatin [Acidobacteriota bacterium]MYJ05253.1 patatin [Acidobacteriota bacterium]